MMGLDITDLSAYLTAASAAATYQPKTLTVGVDGSVLFRKTDDTIDGSANFTFDPALDTLTIGTGLIVGADVNFQYGTPGVGVASDGTYTLSIGPIDRARTGLSSAAPLILMNQDDDIGHTDCYMFSFVDSTSKYAYAEFNFGLVNPGAGSGGNGIKSLYSFGAEGTFLDNGTVSGMNFFLFDLVAQGYLLNITLAAAIFGGTVKPLAGYLSSDGTAGITGGPFTSVTVKDGLVVAGS